MIVVQLAPPAPSESEPPRKSGFEEWAAAHRSVIGRRMLGMTQAHEDHRLSVAALDDLQLEVIAVLGAHSKGGN